MTEGHAGGSVGTGYEHGSMNGYSNRVPCVVTDQLMLGARCFGSRYVCLKGAKLLAMEGNSLTFFLVPLKNSLYISDRRYRL